MAEFVEEKYSDEWEVETPDGWKDFGGIGKTIEYQVYEVCFTDNTSIKCADTHIFILNGVEVFCKDLVSGNVIDSIEGTCKEISHIIKTKDCDNMYDLLGVDGSIYYTDNVASHNSTIVAAFALWYACFHGHKNIGIVSNKEESAKNFLHRLKYMYELMPGWLKPGVPGWAQKTVEFDNHTKIYTAATSKDSFRGEPMGMLICVTGDNTVKLRDKITGEEVTMTMEELANDLRMDS
jgi:hypothetical protein